MSNNCLECGDKLIGRADKKFCNDGCRNAFNNRNNRDANNNMRNINRRLRINYKILSDLSFKEGKAKVTKDRLMKAGFFFEYFTQMKTYKNGATYHYIYDVGYKVLEDDWFLVVKNEGEYI